MNAEKATVSQRLNAIFKGHPVVFMLLAAGITGTMILGYRNFYSPYIERKRRLQAQEYANILFELEQKRKKSEFDN